MNKLKLIKITLLIIILAEEIRSVKGKSINYDDLKTQIDLLKNQNRQLQSFL